MREQRRRRETTLRLERREQTQSMRIRQEPCSAERDPRHEQENDRAARGDNGRFEPPRDREPENEWPEKDLSRDDTPEYEPAAPRVLAPTPDERYPDRQQQRGCPEMDCRDGRHPQKRRAEATPVAHAEQSEDRRQGEGGEDGYENVR